MTGGWEYPEQAEACNLPERAATAFSKAIQGIVGCKYTPVYYVAQQVVRGMNYCIICHTKTATKEPIYGCKAIYINDFQGEVHIVKIEDVIR